MTSLGQLIKFKRMVKQSSIIYVAEAADLLGKSLRTVHRMAADGRLVPVARGRGVRGTLAFNRADVEALLHRDLAGAR